MAGTPANAALWADADVYISSNLSATLPANASTPFGGDWQLVGLLDGDDGFTETRDEDENDYFAWGGILVKTGRSHFKLTKQFSVLEDNAATRSLIWPGSSETELIVPRPANVKVAFETRDGSKIRRLVTRNYGQITVDGDITENETDLAKVTLNAVIYPDGDGVLFDRQATPTAVSLALTPLTLALTVGQIKTVAATVTYSDTTTAVVTSSASWTTSAPSKATVANGFVTGVSAGTSNISASYGGVTATAPSVATVS